MLKSSDFDYDLPEAAIAQDPVIPRDHSKLMVVDMSGEKISHKKFYEIGDFLNPGDVLVLNQSKVIPARIKFEVGGSAREIFVLKKTSDGLYQVIVRPGKFFSLGRNFEIDQNISGEVEGILSDGSRMIKFFGDNIDLSLEELGEAPLPPYIKNSKAGFEQYQTVYASEKGSVAAPTAGLHFTKDLLSRLEKKGVQIEKVTLHVGRGTFLPVSAETISEHIMHPEFFSIDEETAEHLNLAVSEGRRIIAVGTTSVRVLETVYDGNFVAKTGETDIFIYPGKYKWRVVDGLITNFHLPKSTLIMLVASLMESKGVAKPVKNILDLYKLAVKENYRFYSFGDSMFLF